jgi:hypothetical protein
MFAFGLSLLTEATITTGSILQTQIITNCASDYFHHMLEGSSMWLARFWRVFILIIGMFGFVRNETRFLEVIEQT